MDAAKSKSLNRFIEAVELDFDRIAEELKTEQKKSHYIWYMFPQIRGLGQSEYSVYYAINDELEAIEFLNNAFLGTHLVQLCEILLSLETKDPLAIFGELDALKVRSCMTLFARTYENNSSEIQTDNNFSIFRRVLNVFYNGEEDLQTLNLLGY